MCITTYLIGHKKIHRYYALLELPLVILREFGLWTPLELFMDKSLMNDSVRAIDSDLN